MRIGLVHPGEMGAAVGAVLVAAGHDLLWASSGRSAATADRAQVAGLIDVGTLAALAEGAELILSICPPHAALDTARAFAEFDGVYLDANAVSPMTAAEVAATVKRPVDGCIIGSPPPIAGTTFLYLSGPGADHVKALFTGTIVTAQVVSHEIGAASALKMAYAAWTKGSAALLLAALAVAKRSGVEQQLRAQWRQTNLGLEVRAAGAANSALTKGWRWTGEMEEIADTFAAAGLPDGFHRAAAEIYRRAASDPPGDAGADPIESLLTLLSVRAG